MVFYQSIIVIVGAFALTAPLAFAAGYGWATGKMVATDIFYKRHMRRARSTNEKQE